ncbi:MAG TPA: BTAD domain-containing putative transcriptional regulator [Polyangia bacterium]|nr:BTAD domain-containing putative transcriptional regulator [Polyangia bacterium]
MDRGARIYLLGRFSVEVGGKPIPAAAWTKRRPIEVLVALALAAGRVLHREELIDRIWPEKDLDAGANNLHRALHDLRRVTGAEIATLDRGVARLADGVWVDVHAFEDGATSRELDGLARAVELYQGPLLPDDPYSEALGARREALRQRFADAGLRLARLQHAANEGELAIATLRRMLAFDGSLEPAHQLLMRVLAESGRAADALRQFADCTTALRARLDVEPSAATFDIKAAIERGEIAVAKPPAGSPGSGGADVARHLVGEAAGRAIHGRDRALSSARSFVEGQRGVLMVVGEAGLGKTRLVAECARLAAGGGAVVLAGLGLDQDSGVPYGPFAEAWAHHRRTSGATSEQDPFASFSPSGGSAQEDRLRLFNAIEHSIEQVAGRSPASAPVCLVIENLHEADQSSLLLFHHLARATRTLPLMLIGSLREEEVPVGHMLQTLLGSLRRERLATRVDLERLDRDATARLIAELWPDAPSDVAAAVHALAEGNPFHTEEVVQAMREEGTARPAVPANLLETVRHRVRRLGRDAERMLCAAAVAGARFSFEVARRASGLEQEPALDALELAIEARIVEEDGGDYRFRHALTRQAVLDALTSARAAYLHGAVADALEARGDAASEDRAELLAFHLEAAGQPSRALPYLLAAGARAQRHLGFGEAVTFFGKALALMDALGRAEGERRFEVLRKMGGMRMALSDLDGAVRDLDAAAGLSVDEFRPTPTQTALVRRVAALALIQGGHLDEAGRRLDDAVRALGDSADDPELPAALYLFSQLRWHQERFAEAKELARESLDEAERRQDRRAMAMGHEMLALACHALGAWQEGQAHEQQRQGLADGALDVGQAFDVHLCLWEYHLYGEQSAQQIRSAVERTMQQAQRMKAPRAVALCENFSGMLDFQGGRWNEAEAQLRQAIERFRLVGSASGEALSLQRLAVLFTARGEVEASRRLLDEGLVVGGRAAMRSHCLTRIHASLARNRMAAGDREGARASLQEGLAEAERHGNCATCSALLLPEAVRVELAWGEIERADAYAGQLDEVAQRFGSRAWTAMADHARGRVLAARGQIDPAFQALESARVAFEAVGAPYDAARCVMAQSRLFTTARGKVRARGAALAAQAGRVFASLGATDIEA